MAFFSVSDLLCIALPHTILFFVEPQLGAGLASVVDVFPPLFTYGIALLSKKAA